MPESAPERTECHHPALEQSTTQDRSHTDPGRTDTTEAFVPPAPIVGYEILGPLGRGGMGVVYHARQASLHRDVALKMIRGDAVVDRRDLIRFLAEAEAAAAIAHPNVVRVFDYGEQTGRPYMALEFLAGGTLTQRLRTVRMAPTVAVDLVRRIAEGVAAAHDLGIVHRDLKPANVLFDTAGEPKVADFGLAKRGRGVDLTQTQAVMGTPAYMSPEQAKGETKFVGPEADVYALGTILFECLTARRPFIGESSGEVLQQVMFADPPTVRSLATGIPRDLETICLKCLSKEPTARYPTARELAADLARFAAGLPITARPIGFAERGLKWARRNPIIAAMALALVIAAIGLFGMGLIAYQTAIEQASVERGLRQNEQTQREKAEKFAQDNGRLAEANGNLAKQKSDEAKRANEVTDYTLDLFRVSDPVGVLASGLGAPRGPGVKPLTARELLDRGAEKLPAALADQPLARANMLEHLGDVYRSLTAYDKAKPLLDEALAIRRMQLAPDDPLIASSLYFLGWWYQDTGDLIRASESYQAALAIQTVKLPPRHADTIRTLFNHAWVRGMFSDPKAEAMMREVIAAREQSFGTNHRETKLARVGLAAVLLDQHRFQEVGPLLENFASLYEGGTNSFPAEKAVGYFQQAILLRSARLYGPAESALRECLALIESGLGSQNLYAALANYELWKTSLESGSKQSADYLSRTIEICRRTVGFAHPKVLDAIVELAQQQFLSGDLAAALTLWTEVDAAVSHAYGRGHPATGIPRLNIARIEYHLGHTAKADELVRNALLEPNSPYSPFAQGMALYKVGLTIFQRRGDLRLAEAVSRALTAIAKSAASASGLLAFNLHLRILLHIARNEMTEAEVDAKEMEKLTADQANVNDVIENEIILRLVAQVYFRQGNLRAAADQFRKAYTTIRKPADRDLDLYVDTLLQLEDGEGACRLMATIVREASKSTVPIAVYSKRMQQFALIQAITGHAEAARETADRLYASSVTKPSNQRTAHYLLSQVLHGQPGTAPFDASMCTTIHFLPNLPTAGVFDRCRSALAYLRIGLPNEAYAVLESALHGPLLGSHVNEIYLVRTAALIAKHRQRSDEADTYLQLLATFRANRRHETPSSVITDTDDRWMTCFMLQEMAKCEAELIPEPRSQ